MKNHEYAKELICIFDNKLNWQFNLVPTLSIYVEHRLSYEYFSMCTVKIQFVLWVVTETVRFHTAEIFS